MNYINIIDVNDIISDALIEVVNDIYETVVCDEFLYVDIVKHKKSYKKYIDRFLENHKPLNGQINIIYVQCQPKQYWRQNDDALNRFYVNDRFIKINSQKFEEITIEYLLKISKKHKNTFFIFSENMNSYEIKTCIYKIIGKQFLNCNKFGHNNLVEDNNLIQNNLQVEIPNYLILNLETYFREIKLI